MIRRNHDRLANRLFAAQQCLLLRRPPQFGARPQNLPTNCLTQDISCCGFTLWKPLAQWRRWAHDANLGISCASHAKHQWSHGLGGLAGLGSAKRSRPQQQERFQRRFSGRILVDTTLDVRGVSLRFGGVRALTDVSFTIRDGELFSIIGPNGAGKTSMVNCISGRYRPTEGQLFYRGKDITSLNPNARASLGIGRTFQNLALFHHMSVLDNIMVGRHHLLKNNFITGSLYWLTGARREELEHRRKVEEIIDFLDLQAVRKATAGTLPYGLRKRVELARAMALEPKLILLDEPTAGMNFEEKEDMARYIVDLNEEFGMTVVMIEHDMGVVMDISHRVLVLDFGLKIAEGDPASVLADPHVKRAYLGEEDEVLVDPDDKPEVAENAA
jgi:branched-chain amino acid transport system ATP-binding protein